MYPMPLTARLIRLIFLLCLLVMPLCAMADDSRAKVEKALTRRPGDTELRCRLISLLLAEADTARAEKELTYALTMQQAPCLLMHKASIALSRGQVGTAAINCATAIEQGLLPDDEPLILYVDSLSEGMVTLRLQRTVRSTKKGTAVLIGLAQLNLAHRDTTAAINNIEEACLRGDSTLYSRLQSLRNNTPADTSLRVIATIPFIRNRGKIEIDGTLNGLKLKIELDSTAANGTISGVETLFMLKNKYIRSDEVVDDHIVIAREIDLGNGLVLRGVRLSHIRNQSVPLILSLRDLVPLGIPRINEEARCVELLQKPDKQ